MVSDRPGITQEEIANIFQIDNGFIARIVRKLEDNEFIYRVCSPETVVNTIFF